MRIGQLKSLKSDELNFLLYLVNVLDPIRPPDEITPRLLLSIKHDALLFKIAQQQPKLTEEGKKVFHSLMTKLNKTWLQETIEHEHSTKPEFTQSEFSFQQN